MTGNYRTIICPICGEESSVYRSQVTCKRCRDDISFYEKETRQRSRYTIFERDDFKCVYCGRSSIEDGAKLQIDHVIPYSETKDNSIYNVVTACEECNMSKNIRTLSPDVYARIIERNIKLNKKISDKTAKLIEETFDNMYLEMKEDIKPPPPDIDKVRSFIKDKINNNLF